MRPTHGCKSTLNRSSGSTLVETMVSVMIGGLLLLAIAQSTEFAARAMKTALVQLDLTNSKNLILAAIQGPTTCKALFASGIDPTSSSSTGQLTLIIGSNSYNNSTGKVLSPDLQVNSTTGITYIKNANGYPNPPYYSTDAGIMYYPIVGTLTIGVDNLAAVEKRAFGSKYEQLIFPITFTMQKPTTGGSWTIYQCGIKPLPSGSTNNTGWLGSDLTDGTCYVSYVTSNNPVSCNANYYMVKNEKSSSTVTIPARYDLTPAGADSCWCQGNSKGLVCPQGGQLCRFSYCSGYTPAGGYNVNNGCGYWQACHPAGSGNSSSSYCQYTASYTTGSATQAITCCKVRQ